jgi:hypothetical protein
MNGGGKNIFLAVTVQDNLLPETRIPETGDHLGDIGGENILINGNTSMLQPAVHEIY